MPIFDGFSPFVRLTIVTPSNERFPLWADSANGANHEDRPWVEEATAKINLGNVPVLTAKLCPPYEDGIRLLDSPLVEYANDNSLEMEIGYAGWGEGSSVRSAVFRGLMLKPEVNITEEVSITLNAQGIPSHNYASQGGTSTVSGTRREILMQLLRGDDARNRSLLELDDRMVVSLGSGDPTYRLFNVDRLNFSRSGRTDWQIIQQLVWESQCWPLMIGTALRVVPRSILARGETTRTFRVYHHAPTGYVDGTEYPLFNVGSENLAVNLLGPRGEESIRAARQQGMDPETRRPVEATVDDRSARPARSGRNGSTRTPRNTSPGPSPSGRDGIALMPGTPGNARQDAQASAAFGDTTAASGLKLNGELIGIPDLAPSEVIRVEGLGQRFRSSSGFLLMEVTHTVGSDGYKNSVQLLSNSASAVAQVERAFGPSRQETTPPAATPPTSGPSNTVTARPTRAVRR